MKKIWLCIGGDMGCHALDCLNVDEIEAVVSMDGTCLLRAQQKGVWIAHYGDLNALLNQDDALVVMAHYPTIIKPETIRRCRKIYNLHPGYLPFGRGMYPVVWAILKGEPAGATIHEVVEKLDAGPIVAQEQIPIYGTDTAETLHERVRSSERHLFRRLLDRLREGELPDGVPQREGGSYYSRADFERERTRQDREFNRRLRAFHFPAYEGLRVDLGGKHYEVALQTTRRGAGQ